MFYWLLTLIERSDSCISFDNLLKIQVPRALRFKIYNEGYFLLLDKKIGFQNK